MSAFTIKLLKCDRQKRLPEDKVKWGKRDDKCLNNHNYTLENEKSAENMEIKNV